MKSYKLKLHRKTVALIKQIAKRERVSLCMGRVREFEWDQPLPPEIGGMSFDGSDGEKYLYVNDYLPVKDGHDLIALHELGHVLFNGMKFGVHEESMANGFAIGAAKMLGLKIDKKVLRFMKKYAAHVKS